MKNDHKYDRPIASDGYSNHTYLSIPLGGCSLRIPFAVRLKSFERFIRKLNRIITLRAFEMSSSGEEGHGANSPFVASN